MSSCKYKRKDQSKIQPTYISVLNLYFWAMILVTGGTGLVGSHLLLHLAKMDLSVRAIYRNAEKLATVRGVFAFYVNNADELLNKIDWVEADINDIPALESAFDNITEVYHCAALISFDPNDLQLLIDANETGTANVVNLCIARTIRKLCYVSSIAAIGRYEGQAWVSEDTEWRNELANPYALTKHLAEMEVWRATQEGIPVVIINPGVIIGPGFWNSGSGRLFKIAAKGSKYYPPGGTGFVAIEDVVQMMIKLMTSPIKNERFIAVSDNLSYKEILSRIAKNLDKRPPHKELSIGILKMLRPLDWLLNILFGRKRSLSKAQLYSLQNRSYYSNEKVKNMIGYEYGSLDEAINFSSDKFKELSLPASS